MALFDVTRPEEQKVREYTGREMKALQKLANPGMLARAFVKPGTGEMTTFGQITTSLPFGLGLSSAEVGRIATGEYTKNLQGLPVEFEQQQKQAIATRKAYGAAIAGQSIGAAGTIAVALGAPPQTMMATQKIGSKVQSQAGGGEQYNVGDISGLLTGGTSGTEESLIGTEKEPLPQYRKQGGRIKATVSTEKAREIMRHGEVHGKKLTDKQRKFFGWIAGGKEQGKEYYQEGGYIPSSKEGMRWGKYITDPKRRDQHIKDIVFVMLDSKLTPYDVKSNLNIMSGYGSQRGGIAEKGATYGFDYKDIPDEKINRLIGEYNRIKYLSESKPVKHFAGGNVDKEGVTQGASHEDGGIKLIDTGTKKVVGEVEGGERIFSIEATEKMEMLAKQGNTNQLGRFIAEELRKQDRRQNGNYGQEGTKVKTEEEIKELRNKSIQGLVPYYVDENVQRMLSAIRYGESSMDEFQNIPNIGGSSAKGAFQFMPATKDSILNKYGLDAWSNSEIEQEYAALALILDSGQLKKVKEGKFDEAMKVLGGDNYWPSLPVGPKEGKGSQYVVKEGREEAYSYILGDKTAEVQQSVKDSVSRMEDRIKNIREKAIEDKVIVSPKEETVKDRFLKRFTNFIPNPETAKIHEEEIKKENANRETWLRVENYDKATESEKNIKVLKEKQVEFLKEYQEEVKEYQNFYRNNAVTINEYLNDEQKKKALDLFEQEPLLELGRKPVETGTGFGTISIPSTYSTKNLKYIYPSDILGKEEVAVAEKEEEKDIVRLPSGEIKEVPVSEAEKIRAESVVTGKKEGIGTTVAADVTAPEAKKERVYPERPEREEEPAEEEVAAKPVTKEPAPEQKGLKGEDVLRYGLYASMLGMGISAAVKKPPELPDVSPEMKDYVARIKTLALEPSGLSPHEMGIAKQELERGYARDIYNIQNLSGGSAAVALGNIGRAITNYYSGVERLTAMDVALKREQQRSYLPLYGQAVAGIEGFRQQRAMMEYEQEMKTKAAGAGLAQTAIQNALMAISEKKQNDVTAEWLRAFGQDLAEARQMTKEREKGGIGDIGVTQEAETEAAKVVKEKIEEPKLPKIE